MLEKLHGGVACAHCRAIADAAQGCPICGQAVCAACLARDNCAAPRLRTLELGDDVFVRAVDAQGRLALVARQTNRGPVDWLHDLTADRRVGGLPEPARADGEVSLHDCCGFAAGRLIWMAHDKPRAPVDDQQSWFMAADLAGEAPVVLHETSTWHYGFHHFDLSSDGRWIVGADYGVKVYLFEGDWPRRKATLDLGDQVVHSVALSLELDLLAVGLFGAVHLFALSDQRDLGRLRIADGELTCLCLGGGRLAAISEDEVAHVVEIDRQRPPARWTQRALERFKASGKLRRGEAALSPDGRLLAARQRKRELVVFDLETGAPQRLKGHRGRVGLVRFVAGERLLSADDEGGVRFWPRQGQRLVDRG